MTYLKKINGFLQFIQITFFILNYSIIVLDEYIYYNYDNLQMIVIFYSLIF